MNRAAFIHHIQKRSGLDDIDAANWVCETVLKTLNQRLTDEEAHDLAAQLPKSLKSIIGVPKDQLKKMSPAQFIQEVSAQLDISLDEAEQ